MHDPSIVGPGADRPVVLVVEDEHFVRLIAVETIAEAGYDVIEAEDADRAMTVLDGRDDIDILFTDIKMPGQLDGLALAAIVRQRWPAIPIILTSGHMFEGDVGIEDAACFLQKPYRPHTLIDQLMRLTR